ncbi:MAG: hypothetical protein AAF391_13355 [Bacteroidota bacterium]
MIQFTLTTYELPGGTIMITAILNIFLTALTIYLILGLLFSVYFYWKGASLIDQGTKDSPWHFKLIIFPGVVLLWVALFAKLIKKND